MASENLVDSEVARELVAEPSDDDRPPEPREVFRGELAIGRVEADGLKAHANQEPVKLGPHRTRRPPRSSYSPRRLSNVRRVQYRYSDPQNRENRDTTGRASSPLLAALSPTAAFLLALRLRQCPDGQTGAYLRSFTRLHRDSQAEGRTDFVFGPP